MSVEGPRGRGLGRGIPEEGAASETRIHCDRAHRRTISIDFARVALAEGVGRTAGKQTNPPPIER